MFAGNPIALTTSATADAMMAKTTISSSAKSTVHPILMISNPASVAEGAEDEPDRV